MSIDTHAEHATHGEHHDTPDVVDSRNRMGVWLFIGGDMITLSAIIFTYLYLRGVNTGGHWMSMVGYTGHTYAWYENALGGAGLPAATLITVGKVSGGLNWLGTGLTVVSAGIVWAAEKGLRTTRNAKSYSTLAWLATAVTVAAMVFTVVQLRHIPQIFVANNDSQTMSYTAYDSSMMLIIGSSLVHLFILAFLGLGLAIRSARGVLNGENWFHARVVRLFWVWVAVSAVLISALTSTINVIH